MPGLVLAAAGAEYSSGLDAVVKLAKLEGPGAFFKGFLASFLRLGPHFTLTFVFFEQLKRLSLNSSERREEKEYREKATALFRAYDANSDGIMSGVELTKMLEDAFPYDAVPHLQRAEYNAMIESNVAAVLEAAHAADKGGVILVRKCGLCCFASRQTSFSRKFKTQDGLSLLQKKKNSRKSKLSFSCEISNCILIVE